DPTVGFQDNNLSFNANKGADGLLFDEGSGGSGLLFDEGSGGSGLLFDEGSGGSGLLFDEGSGGSGLLLTRAQGAVDYFLTRAQGAVHCFLTRARGSGLLFDEGSGGSGLLFDEGSGGSGLLFDEGSGGSALLFDEGSGGSGLLFDEGLCYIEDGRKLRSLVQDSSSPHVFIFLWSLHRLVFGTLYPAYYSYKAVKTKNVKEYVRWMMYWIVFALYTVVETITDLTVAWFPLYYEIKIAFVIWLLSPYTRGASLIYRKCLHPLLSSREREIDEYIVQAKERSYETMVTFGKQGLSIAATAAVSAAVKGQGAITEKLRSFSMHDLTQIPLDDAAANQIYTAHAGNPAVSRRALAANSTDRTEYPV
ncbi:uncharacterized protein LOC135532650, partial [Oncorhynchus masou masou]|uniref:uncharacterized protein LOC135532650 n=1 Tax=Oncorhynchus masou masou TaxID=90313 RepID=UPI00318395C5